jgi:cytosine/uracil/thiamine/allantoin permease
LTYPRREAVYCLIVGYAIDAIPMILNGVIGAELHVSFPVVARASFGFKFSKFAVVIRMITALFWHGMLLLPSRLSSLTMRSYSDIHRLNSNDSGHSSNLALVFRHPKPHS